MACNVIKKCRINAKGMLKEETTMQRKNLAVGPNLRKNARNKKGCLSPTGGASLQKEAQRERGILSYRREMRDFVFLEQSRVKEMIRYQIYRSGGDSLQSYQLETIVYGPINRKR